MPKTVKRLSPLSIRLSQPERESLELRAHGGNLSAYVKSVLFNADAPSQSKGLSVADRTLLSHLLATLGGSNVAPNLDRIAHHAANGDLEFESETIEELRQACDDVRLMHNALMRGLGLKEAKPSRRQLGALDAFNRAARQRGQQ